MSEVRTGLRAILNLSWVYSMFQELVGADRLRRQFREYLDLEPGLQVLDLGCGTGDLLPWLGQVDYVGVDWSLNYIEEARRRFPGPATFIRGSVLDPLPPGPFDRILAVGLLHHLDNASCSELVAQVAHRLTPGGRFVTIDCCYHSQQSPWARWLVSRDRGQNVRSPEEYASFATTRFKRVQPHLHTRLLRIPYSHCALVCEKE